MQATEEIKDILFIDVTPLTLGIETVGGVMTFIIKRGTGFEKGVGKNETISITNDKSRLTKEEIVQMIAHSEKFADEDKAI